MKTLKCIDLVDWGFRAGLNNDIYTPHKPQRKPIPQVSHNFINKLITTATKSEKEDLTSTVVPDVYILRNPDAERRVLLMIEQIWSFSFTIQVSKQPH